MIYPGKHYINGNVRITARVYADDDANLDPTSLIFKVKDPRGDTTTYTYGVGDTVSKETVGSYYIDLTPAYSGKWFWRWEATGSGFSLAKEGIFYVQKSAFFDDESSSDYMR